MPTGREIIAALKKAATWGTEVACGAGDGLLLLSESLGRDQEVLKDESMGLDFVEAMDVGGITVEGQLEAYLRYDGLDVPVALAMGTAGAPTQQGVTAAYANTYRLAASLQGLFATLAMQKLPGTSGSVHVVPSLKMAGFTIKGEAGKAVTIAFDTLGDNLIRNSSTNTPTTMANVTYPEKKHRVLMKQGVFRVNDQSGAALGAGDEIYPSTFELTFKRQMSGVLVAGQGDDVIDEPDEDGFPEITLKIEFPRYLDDAQFNAWTGGTAKKMDITFTGALIEDTYYRTFQLSFPHLRVAKVEEPTNGPGKIPQSVTYEVLAADAAPTGMSYTDPFWIDVINTRTTDPLA